MGTRISHLSTGTSARAPAAGLRPRAALPPASLPPPLTPVHFLGSSPPASPHSGLPPFLPSSFLRLPRFLLHFPSACSPGIHLHPSRPHLPSPPAPRPCPHSSSASRLRAGRRPGVLSPGSTWRSSCRRFSGRRWGACRCFPRGRKEGTGSGRRRLAGVSGCSLSGCVGGTHPHGGPRAAPPSPRPQPSGADSPLAGLPT